HQPLRATAGAGQEGRQGIVQRREGRHGDTPRLRPAYPAGGFSTLRRRSASRYPGWTLGFARRHCPQGEIAGGKPASRLPPPDTDLFRAPIAVGPIAPVDGFANGSTRVALAQLP